MVCGLHPGGDESVVPLRSLGFDLILGSVNGQPLFPGTGKLLVPVFGLKLIMCFIADYHNRV